MKTTLDCTLPSQPYHITFRAQAGRLVEDTLCKMIRAHGFPQCGPHEPLTDVLY